jgi:hypothetical protein
VRIGLEGHMKYNTMGRSRRWLLIAAVAVSFAGEDCARGINVWVQRRTNLGS